MRVAVIGAGAAGLVACRELVKAGFKPRVFERHASEVGGVWVLPDEPSDPEGDRYRSSMYPSLRTNLPKDLMAFLDFPMEKAAMCGHRRYPGHECIAAYLRRFSEHFDLLQYIRFKSNVTEVTKQGSNWHVVLEDSPEESFEFDAIVVANGHYFRPRFVDIPGQSVFPNRVIHSQSYYDTTPFVNQTVCIVGASASGVDLAREIRRVAKCVYLCHENFAAGQEKHIAYRPMVISMHADGRVEFADGSMSLPVDTFIFATGYHYSFPFLKDGLVSVKDNRVQPLYKHLVHIEEPTIFFVGLPLKVIPFPLFEMQSRYVARLLRGDFKLPTKDVMYWELGEEHAGRMQFNGGKTRHSHMLGGELQTRYYNELARCCGASSLPQYFLRLKAAHYANLLENSDKFRDVALPHIAMEAPLGSSNDTSPSME